MIYTAIKRMTQDMLTLAKVMIKSGRPSRVPESASCPARSIIVMGNGPGLRKAMEEERDELMSMPRMAVNFAANAPEYFELRPEYYVLADPHFFESREPGVGRGEGLHFPDPNVGRLWGNIARTSWPMHLWLPVRFRRAAAPLIASLPPEVTPLWYNLTPGEGGGALTRLLYRLGLAMPRPRNVLIPAIMMAMREGYREIYLTGADHSWLQSLRVDDRNRVVSVQPHFYKDNEKELERVAQEYAGYHLHDILGSMTVAFRSYFDIKSYAERRGVSIYNATPGSYIDAFPRRLLRE